MPGLQKAYPLDHSPRRLLSAVPGSFAKQRRARLLKKGADCSTPFRAVGFTGGKPERRLRLKAVHEPTGLSRSTICCKVQDGHLSEPGAERRPVRRLGAARRSMTEVL